MAKGYWIARVDIRDAERYKDYVSAAKVAFEKYGATFLARGGPFTELEGKARARNVIIEFPSHQAAVDLLQFARIPDRSENPPGSGGCRNGRRRRHLTVHRQFVPQRVMALHLAVRFV